MGVNGFQWVSGAKSEGKQDVLKAGHGARLSCVWCCPEQDRAAHCRVLREAPAHLYLLVDGSSFFEQSLGPGAVFAFCEVYSCSWPAYMPHHCEKTDGCMNSLIQHCAFLSRFGRIIDFVQRVGYLAKLFATICLLVLVPHRSI